MSESQLPEQAHYVKTTETSRIGDLGIRFSLDSNSRRLSKRKKRGSLEAIGGYMCFSCGNLDSPEWRKGPHGPKTLCNACGCKLVLLKQNARNNDWYSALGKGPKERAK
jgi:hypothetical protein